MDPNEPYCFLICSFAESARADQVRRYGINPATNRFGFPTYRIDEIPTSSLVIEATREYIAEADFVIADLSSGSPNCYYEVGYAHALGRPVVHMIQADEEPKFNVAGLHFLKYKDPAHLRDLLQTHILRTILSTHGFNDAEDENKGHFGRRAFADDYIVTGRVWEIEENDSADEDDDDDDDEEEVASGYSSGLVFSVEVRVRSIDPKRPLTGYVTFHLHPSFKNPERRVLARDGVASIEVPTLGTFTLGVTLHQSKTKLELDLSRAPGSGAEFRSR